MDTKLEFGKFIQQMRKEKNYTLKFVADKLEMDLSMLSKIEHGERQVQSHMLKALAEMFDLNYKELQIMFIHKRIDEEIGNEPFLIESLQTFLEKNKK